LCVVPSYVHLGRKPRKLAAAKGPDPPSSAEGAPTRHRCAPASGVPCSASIEQIHARGSPGIASACGLVRSEDDRGRLPLDQSCSDFLVRIVRNDFTEHVASDLSARAFSTHWRRHGRRSGLRLDMSQTIVERVDLRNHRRNLRAHPHTVVRCSTEHLRTRITPRWGSRR
jgi:hypothetical protein